MTDVLDRVFTSIAGEVGRHSGVTTVTGSQQCYLFKGSVNGEMVVLLTTEARFASAGNEAPAAG